MENFLSQGFFCKLFVFLTNIQNFSPLTYSSRIMIYGSGVFMNTDLVD